MRKNASVKNIVIPAKAGIQRSASARHITNTPSNQHSARPLCSLSLTLDSRLRGKGGGGKSSFLILSVFLLTLLSATPAFASTQAKTLGTFGAWKAYAYDEGGQTVCYMVTTKNIKPLPKKNNMPAYLMITHRPIEASTDVISYAASMPLDSSRGVKMHVGTSNFSFFSVGNTAWARDALIDHRIAAALQHAPTAQFTGFPAKKGVKPIKDSFDLTGAEPAYRAIGKACGLPQPKQAPKKAPHKVKHK